jgi:hypothetical protein
VADITFNQNSGFLAGHYVFVAHYHDGTQEVYDDPCNRVAKLIPEFYPGMLLIYFGYPNCNSWEGCNYYPSLSDPDNTLLFDSASQQSNQVPAVPGDNMMGLHYLYWKGREQKALYLVQCNDFTSCSTLKDTSTAVPVTLTMVYLQMSNDPDSGVYSYYEYIATIPDVTDGMTDGRWQLSAIVNKGGNGGTEEIITTTVSGDNEIDFWTCEITEAGSKTKTIYIPDYLNGEALTETDLYFDGFDVMPDYAFTTNTWEDDGYPYSNDNC